MFALDSKNTITRLQDNKCKHNCSALKRKITAGNLLVFLLSYTSYICQLHKGVHNQQDSWIIQNQLNSFPLLPLVIAGIYLFNFRTGNHLIQAQTETMIMFSMVEGTGERDLIFQHLILNLVRFNERRRKMVFVRVRDLLWSFHE